MIDLADLDLWAGEAAPAMAVGDTTNGRVIIPGAEDTGIGHRVTNSINHADRNRGSPDAAVAAAGPV